MIIDEEFENLIPPLKDEEYKGLEESILAEGCRDALVVWNDTLIDGHNRYKICTEHNVPFNTVQKDFTDRDEAMLWIVKNQLSRRNLNDFQHCEIVRKYEKAVQAQARKRQATSTGGANPQLQEKFPEAENAGNQSRDTLGEMAGVSGKTYEHATAIIDKASEAVKNAVRNDELSINAGYEVTKMKPEQQHEVSERIEQGEKPKDVVKDVRERAGISEQEYERATEVLEKAPEEVVQALRKGKMSINEAHSAVKKAEKKAERQKDIQRQIEEIEQNKPEVPDGLFDVIVIDPPWAYGTGYDAAGRRCANPYPEMTQEELKKIEIPASEDSVLFLWTTHKFIWDAKELLDFWGFEYRNMIVWDKKVMGMGNLFRMRCEFCLVGIRGKPTFQDVHDIEDIIEERRREHSRKPDAFYERVVNRLCVGRKLDYFSRTNREGWDVFGNDTDKFRMA